MEKEFLPRPPVTGQNVFKVEEDGVHIGNKKVLYDQSGETVEQSAPRSYAYSVIGKDNSLYRFFKYKL